MATMYLMSLEDRTDLARHQIERVKLGLEHLIGMLDRDDLVEAVTRAASQLQHIGELIGR